MNSNYSIEKLVGELKPRESLHHDCGNGIYLSDNQIEVLKEYQKNLIASSLMEYLINRAKEKQLDNITLEVKKDNYQAINLYHKYKFIEVGNRKGYYNGIDAILMELILDLEV